MWEYAQPAPSGSAPAGGEEEEEEEEGEEVRERSQGMDPYYKLKFT